MFKYVHCYWIRKWKDNSTVLRGCRSEANLFSAQPVSASCNASLHRAWKSQACTIHRKNRVKTGYNVL
jgi:hypothetical protein